MITVLQRVAARLAGPKRQPLGPTHVYAMRLENGAGGVPGTLIRLSPEQGEFAQATMHPDGHSVAFWGQHPDLPGRHIWLANIAEHSCRPLTTGPGLHGHPAWWPDGQSLVYFATQDPVDWHPEAQFDPNRPSAHLYRKHLETGQTEQLTEGPFTDERPTVTPDGKTIIFVSNRAGTSLNLWSLNLETKTIRQLTHNPTLDYRPVVAPNNQKIAYFTQAQNTQHHLALISHPGATPLALRLRRSFKWIHGPWWAADSRHLLVHGLTEGNTRPALWVLDSDEGACTRLWLPSIEDASHGTWDRAQSSLAFDSRQAIGLQSPNHLSPPAPCLHQIPTK